MTTVVVTGDRNWDNQALVDSVLDDLVVEFGDITIIEGGARGADACAAAWAERTGATHRQYPANWGRYKNGAGPKRNQQMLDEEDVDLVVAFHPDLTQSRGTADMVRRVQKAGIDLREYQR